MPEETKKIDPELIRQVAEAVRSRGPGVWGTIGEKTHGGPFSEWLKAKGPGAVDEAAANRWFTQYWPEPRRCPVCTNKEWGLISNFVNMPLEPVGTNPVGTYQPVRTTPFVAVICRTCGNTLFFNAVIMGLLPKDQR